MEDKIKLTAAEQIRIRDLINEILKNKDGAKREEIINGVMRFVEGVKLGLANRPST